MEKHYDLIVYGATGVTGREALRHLLATRPDEPARWAIAGRSGGRLRALCEPHAEDLDVVVADAGDPVGAATLASATRVLLNLAGPFGATAPNLVRACIANDTDYLDLSAAVWLLRRLASDHHAAAKERGLKVVVAAGYDALPFDLGTLAMVDAVRQRFDEACREVRAVVTTRSRIPVRPRDLLSSGSVGSIRELLEVGEADSRRDPAALLPAGADAVAVRTCNRIDLGVAYDDEAGAWTGPVLPLPFINPQVILRSRALYADIGYAYGDGFRYVERSRLGASRAEAAQRAGVHAAAALVRAQTSFIERAPRWAKRGAARLLDRFGPAPGSGPNERAMAGIDYTIDFRARSGSGQALRGSLDGRGHPGYRSTAAMAIEAARALALDRHRLPPIYGVVTPAAALGLGVWERLRDAGLQLEME